MSRLESKTVRGNQWIEFATQVLKHIDLYTVKQYGDGPNDAVAKFTPAQVISSIERYCARFGKNSREGQDKLDVMKIAHYACLLAEKIEAPVESNVLFEGALVDAYKYLCSDIELDETQVILTKK